MKTYILSVIGAVFLLDMVCILLPSGKMAKTVTGVVKLVGVAVMLSPVLSLLQDAEFSFSSDESAQADGNVLNKSLCLQAERLIEDNFALSCSVEKEEDTFVIYLASFTEEEEQIGEAIALVFGAEAAFVYGG